MRPRDGVGHHRGVRVAKVRLGVDVVDRRGDVEGVSVAHDEGKDIRLSVMNLGRGFDRGKPEGLPQTE